MPLQENVPGVGTTKGPSWTAHDGNSVWLAWKGSGTDTGIYVASAPSLQPASSGQYSFSPQAKVLALGTSASPAIASLNGALYLFYKGASDNFIYWASMANGSSTWVDQHKLSLGDSLNPAANDQHPQTAAGPTVVSANGCLYLFWVGASDQQIWWTASLNADVWMDQVAITTPTGTPKTDASPGATLAGETIHLTWKGQGENSIWWATYSTPVTSGEGGEQLDTDAPWGPQSNILSGTAFAPALVCDGNGVVWLAWTGSNGGVSYASLDSGKWIGQSNRLGIGSSDRPALISTGIDSTLIMMAWKGGGSDGGIYYGSMIGPQVGIPTGPGPGTALGSNLNYVMTSNCNPLTGVSVVINVTQDIIGSIGFGFQLNAYSLSGSTSAWQQFFIWFQPASDNRSGVLKGQIEPWPKSTAGTGTETTKYDLINHSFVLQNRQDNKIPAGYQLTIALGTDSSLNNSVNNCTFTVVDDHGTTQYNHTTGLIGLALDDGSGGNATNGDLAPIVAFQLDFVGPINSQNTVLSSGAGSIAYYATSPLTAAQNMPSCTDSYWHTLETANSAYGTLPQGTSNSFKQTFTFVAAS